MAKVSLCIPTYNSARFLRTAIDSALAQRFADLEVVICDNASTDETPHICQQYRDRRLRYHRFEALVGQGANWNRCISLAAGEYVALLHADDEYLPTFLGERAQQLDAHSNVGLAFGAVELIDESGRGFGKQAFSGQEFVTQPGEFYGDLLMGCIISPAAPLVRRSCYLAAGPFDESRLWAIDWDMWLRIAAIAGVSYSPIVSSRYRVHGASGSATGLLGPRYAQEDLQVLREALGRLEKDPLLAAQRPRRRAALHAFSRRALYAAGANCEAGLRTAALGNLAAALRTRPTLASKPTTWALLAGVTLGPWSYDLWRKLRGIPSTRARSAPLASPRWIGRRG